MLKAILLLVFLESGELEVGEIEVLSLPHRAVVSKLVKKFSASGL